MKHHYFTGLDEGDSRLLKMTHGTHTTFSKVAAGGRYNAAVTEDGVLVLWGKTDIAVNAPAISTAAGMTDVLDIKAGRHFLLVLKKDHTVHFFGNNTFHQGGPSGGHMDVGGNVTKMFGGHDHTIFIVNGRLKTCGHNNYGQLIRAWDSNMGCVTSDEMGANLPFADIDSGSENWKSEYLEAWLKTKPRLDSEFLYLPDWHPSKEEQVMHEWERPLMKADAEQICSKGGSVLNIGYGMGIIDGYIKELKPAKHTIIEIHPEIAAMAIDAGHENVLVGDWLYVVKDLDEQFDAIYFDTFSFDNRPDFGIFAAHYVDKLLNPGGIFSYFNFDQGAALHNGVAGLCETLGWQKQIKVIEFSRDGDNTEHYESIIWHKS